MFGVFLTCVFLLQGLSGVDSEKVSVMEGDSVTLHTGIKTNQDRINWFFNTDRIARISGDQSKICEDAECPERFRDRLKLDHVTGSLTITNITNTDSGEYTLDIISRRSEKTFSVSVHGSGLSLSVVAGICAAVVILLVTAAAGVMYLKRKKRRGAEPNNDQENTMKYSTVNQTETATIGSSYKRTETATEKPV